MKDRHPDTARPGKTPSDTDPLVVTLTRTQLAEAVRDAVSEAVGGASRLVDKQELAQRLGCSPAHVDHLRKRGMPWVPVGMSVRFEPGKVIEWLRAQAPVT